MDGVKGATQPHPGSTVKDLPTSLTPLACGSYIQVGKIPFIHIWAMNLTPFYLYTQTRCFNWHWLFQEYNHYVNGGKIMFCCCWNFIKTCSQFQKISLLMARPPEVLVLPATTAVHTSSPCMHSTSARSASNYFIMSAGVVMPEHLHNEIHHFIMILLFFPFFCYNWGFVLTF